MDAYAQIAESLPRLDRYQAMFQQDDFQRALALVYSSILDFHGRVYKYFRRRGEDICGRLRFLQLSCLLT